MATLQTTRKPCDIENQNVTVKSKQDNIIRPVFSWRIPSTFLAFWALIGSVLSSYLVLLALSYYPTVVGLNLVLLLNLFMVALSYAFVYLTVWKWDDNQTGKQLLPRVTSDLQRIDNWRFCGMICLVGQIIAYQQYLGPMYGPDLNVYSIAFLTAWIGLLEVIEWYLVELRHILHLIAV